MGQEYRRALCGGILEPRVIKAVGVWFFCSTTHRYLYLLRNDTKYPNTWGLAGGKVEAGESLGDSVRRECTEELGYMPNYSKLIPLEKFTSPDQQFEYHTFWCCVDTEFTPMLNHEHSGYAWIDSGVLPKPLHPGFWNTVNIDAVQQKVAQVEQAL